LPILSYTSTFEGIGHAPIQRRVYKSVYTQHHSDKKEKKIFLINKKIQSGAVAKSYMRTGFLIYEEMRKYFPICEEAIYDYATAPL
jgi:hypothetical protein